MRPEYFIAIDFAGIAFAPAFAKYENGNAQNIHIHMYVRRNVVDTNFGFGDALFPECMAASNCQSGLLHISAISSQWQMKIDIDAQTCRLTLSESTFSGKINPR